MKKSFLSLLLLCSVTSVFALENGDYTNLSSTTLDMFHSLSLNTQICTKGGAQVKFYGADAMNFCIGTDVKKVFKYKKCIGKESGYPFKTCFGIKKEVEQVTTNKVSEATDGTVILAITNSDDGKVFFEQSYAIRDLGRGEVRVITKFKDNRDGRTGYEEYLFTQKK